MLEFLLFQGQLTGYIDRSSNVLEVTHSIPSPVETEDNFDEPERYALDYLKYIREKGCDHLQVGWYTSSLNSEIFTRSFLNNLVSFQVTNIFVKVFLIKKM